MDNWVSVFSTTEEFEAERIKELLMAEEIPAVVMNQKDSAYTMLGDISVMVNKEDRERAEIIIKQEIGE